MVFNSSWISREPPTESPCSVRAELAAHLGSELRGIEAVAVPEYDPHVPDNARVGRKVAAQHHEVRGLAWLDRADSRVFAEDASTIERHDLNGGQWTEACFDQQLVISLIASAWHEARPPRIRTGTEQAPSRDEQTLPLHHARQQPIWNDEGTLRECRVRLFHFPSHHWREHRQLGGVEARARQ